MNGTKENSEKPRFLTKVKSFGKVKQVYECLERSMKILGLNISTKERSYYSVFVIMSATALSFTTIGVFQIAHEKSNLVSTITFQIWFLRCILSLSSLYRFQFCRIQLLRIKTELSTLIKRRASRAVAIRLSVFWVLFICNVLCLILYTHTLEGKNLAVTMLSNFNLSFTLKQYLFTFQQLLLMLLLFLPEMHIFLFYTIACLDISEEFKRLHDNFLHDSTINARKAVSLCAESYSQLCRLLDMLEDAYSPILFLCTLNIGIELVSNINSTIILDAVHSPLYFLCVTITTLQPFYIFGDLCNASTHVMNKARQVSSIMYKQSLTFDDSILREYVFRFYMQSAVEPPSLSAWKTFPINRGLLLTVLSVAITYLVVMFQLNI